MAIYHLLCYVMLHNVTYIWKKRLAHIKWLQGDPWWLDATPPGLRLDKDLEDTCIVSYCVQLTNVLRSMRLQVKAALPAPASGPLHNLQPGDWWKTSEEHVTPAQVESPYQVLLTTSTATWVEATPLGSTPATAKGSTSTNRGIREKTHLERWAGIASSHRV